MRIVLLVLLSLILTWFSANPASAQPATITPVPADASAVATAATKLRVVTRNLEPFSFEKAGRRVGFAAELWELFARSPGVDYEVTVVGTAQEIIEVVRNRTGDVGVGP